MYYNVISKTNFSVSFALVESFKSLPIIARMFEIYSRLKMRGCTHTDCSNLSQPSVIVFRDSYGFLCPNNIYRGVLLYQLQIHTILYYAICSILGVSGHFLALVGLCYRMDRNIRATYRIK